MNFKSRIIIGCLLGACTLQVSAEKTYKYRINLRDKRFLLTASMNMRQPTVP